MIRTIDRFLHSWVFLILTAAATVVVWSFGWASIGIPVILALIFLQFVLFKDAMPSFPLLLAGMFMFRDKMEGFQDIPWYLFAVPPAILLGMLVHMIRFRTRFWEGKMIGGILLMFVAMVFSAFNAVSVTIYYLFYALIGLLYAFLYMFYRNSLEGDHVEYLLRMMMLAGLVVASEVLIWYLTTEDVLTAIENKEIQLGLGNSNYVATYLLMFLPPALYYAKKWKWGFFLIVAAVFEAGMLCLTGSRGGMVALAIVAVPLAVYTLKSRTWLKSLSSLFAAGLGIFLLWYFNREWFAALLERLMVEQLDDSGRFEIYREAWETFKAHPLLGGGLFARIDGNDVYHMYHNTFLHTLATLGFLGFLGLAWQLLVQFASVFGRKGPERFALGLALIGPHLHGMLDNIYYMPQFMILMIVMVAVTEQSNLRNLPVPPRAA